MTVSRGDASYVGTHILCVFTHAFFQGAKYPDIKQLEFVSGFQGELAVENDRRSGSRAELLQFQVSCNA